ncbi:MAG TPA: hypothetical protein VFI70_08050 [Nitrososphaeraceae archaeon]|nr:hypothetical protein [Nitrososphaeraceae archaeon]
MVSQLRKETFDDVRIKKNAGLIVGCEIIDFENRFTGIVVEKQLYFPHK